MKTIKQSQKGLTIIEFTLVSTLMFLVTFALIEFGIYMYSMQDLNNRSREAARLATVCYPLDITDDLSSVITISYLDASYSKVTDIENDFSIIRFVKAEINDNYTFRFSGILSFIGDSGVINMPPLETILPSESLGILRVEDNGSLETSSCSLTYKVELE